MSRFAGRARVAVAAIVAVASACRAGTIVVGDDGAEAYADAGGDARTEDARTEDATVPSTVDASGCLDAGGTCVSSATSCSRPNPQRLCPEPNNVCCMPACPPVSAAPPGMCDGGLVVPTYMPSGCAAGHACAPTDCTAAGATCVAAGACDPQQTADAAAYQCASGLTCCLP